MDFSGMGTRIKQRRKTKEMTQDDLAEKVGVSPGFVGMIERGERAPSLDVFVLLANELGVTADELLSGVVVESVNARLAQYGSKLSKMSTADVERIFAMLDIAMNMGDD